MTAKQLIELLQHYPPDTKLFVDGYEFGVDELTTVAETWIVKDEHTEDYAGPHEQCTELEAGAYKSWGRAVEFGLIIHRSS